LQTLEADCHKRLDASAHIRSANLPQPSSARAGSYRRDGLMARFGPDIALPDLLMELAQCERSIRLEMQFKLMWAHRP